MLTRAPIQARPSASPLVPLVPLLPRVALGDESAVRACFERYRRLVYSLAWRALKDARDVEEACQDIFLALWKGAASFDETRGSEATFVMVIARRRIIDRARAPGTRPLPVMDELPPPSASALEDYVDARRAVAALAACSEEQRKVILLSAFHGLTQEEIARELAIPLGTVKSHYTRGIDRVKNALRANEVRR